MPRLWFIGLLFLLAGLGGGATLYAAPAGLAARAAQAPSQALVPLVPTATATATPASPAWSLVSSPDPGSARNDLRGVWAAGANDVWAVGFAAGSTGIEQTLILHNTGSGWTVASSPNSLPGDNYLFGISGSAANNIWAVGYYLSADGYRPLSLHWDGSAWSVVPVATAGASSYYLYGVSARAANDVWAVGTADSASLIEHWNGSAWTIVPSPNVGTGRNVLAAVSADAANDAWAVGALPDGGPALLLHWDGTAWTGGSTTMAYTLNGVHARAPNDVWAVGTVPPYGVYTLAMHWDGSAWTVVITPNQGNYSILRSVFEVAPNDIWAMGVYNVNDTGLRPFFLHGNGSTWTVTPGEIAGPEHNDFYGLAVVNTTDVWTAGHYRALSTSAGRQTLVEHYCLGCAPPSVTPTSTPLGTATVTPSPSPSPSCVPVGTRVPSPNHPGARWTTLNGVGGSAANDVWAVGHYDDLSTQAFAMHWDGSTWTETANASYSLLSAVAALSPSDAWAVGWRIQHWDGTAWTVTPAPSLYYYGVAAKAANDVWAVGSGIAHWNGTTWSQVPSPPVGGLNGLTIVAANNIWAAGSYCTGDLDPCRTLIEHWDGVAWRIVSSPNVGTGDNNLSGIAAVSATDIWAAGNGSGAALVEHWDGSAWTVRPGPSLASLTSLAAPAANNLWATSGGAQVAHWDGARWTIIAPQSQVALSGIFARTPGDVWAVGSGGDHNTDTVTEHFTGVCQPPPTVTPSPVITPTVTATPNCASGWNIVASPALAGHNVLGGVAVVARDDIWAVGGWGELIEHWDGSQWQVVPSSGAPGAELFGVAALSVNDVWAVGYAYSGFNQTLIEHWDGSVWTRVPSPNVYGAVYNELFTISPHTATDIWAVGYYGPGANNQNQTLALHWDGTLWSVVPTANVGTGHNFLWAVASGAANDAWAAGYYQSADQQTAQVLIEHWDGSAWTRSLTPDFSTHDTAIRGISIVAPNDIWAVGYQLSQTLVLHWDGSQWQRVAAPSPGSAAALEGLAVLAPDNIWTSGWASPDQPIIEHWDGTAWTLVAILGIRAGSLQDIDAVDATDLWAVGSYSNGSHYQTLIEHYSPCITPTPAPTRTPSPTFPPATLTPTGTQVAATRTSAPGTPTPVVATTTPAATGTATATAPPTITPCPLAFSDVPVGSPFYPYIRCLACRGILNGYSSSPPCAAGVSPCFQSGANITRGQVAKIVANAAGFSEAIPSTQQTFEDVAASQPFWVYVERLAAPGRAVLSGYTCGVAPAGPCVAPGNRPYFLPGNVVTRGQLAKIDANAAGLAAPVPSTQQTFEDVSTANPFWLYIERLAPLGVISGYICGQAPAGPCVLPGNRPYFLWANAVTRGQGAKFVANTFYPSCQTPVRR